MAEPVNTAASPRHADSPSAYSIKLDSFERQRLVAEAEHWLSTLRGRPGQARLVLDIGQSGLTIKGGAGC